MAPGAPAAPAGPAAPRDHFRAHARRKVELDAALRARGRPTRHEARVRDLGLGGACLEMIDLRAAAGVAGSDPSNHADDEETSLAALVREAPVSLELMAPTLWDPLLLDGRLAWVRRAVTGRPLRAGVRFEHRDGTALYALFQLLTARVDGR